MFLKSPLAKNASFLVGQIVSISLTTFVSYRIIILNLGPEMFGAWVLLLAIIAIAQIGNWGFSTSIIKYISMFNAQGNRESLNILIETSIVSVALFVGFLLVLMYPLLIIFLPLVISDIYLDTIFQLIPIVFISILFRTIAGTLNGTLDGIERFDVRSTIVSISYLLNLFLIIILISSEGLNGVVIAHTIQSVFQTIIAWIYIKREFNALPIVPYRWKKIYFKEMFSYGLNFQVITIFQILFDPLTKTLLAKFGGLNVVTYYAIALFIIGQVRLLLVSINQVIVPQIAYLQEKNPIMINLIYLKSLSVISYLSIPLFGYIIILAPQMPTLWFGYNEPILVYFTIILCISQFINILNVPAFYVYLGIGKLIWNTISNISIGILNLIFGIAFGIIFGWLGVAFGVFFSVIIGGFIISISYHLQNGIKLRQLLPKENIVLLVESIISLMIVFLFYLVLKDLLGVIPLLIITSTIYILLIFIPLWLHPTRKQITKFIITK